MAKRRGWIRRAMIRKVRLRKVMIRKAMIRKARRNQMITRRIDAVFSMSGAISEQGMFRMPLHGTGDVLHVASKHLSV